MDFPSFLIVVALFERFATAVIKPPYEALLTWLDEQDFVPVFLVALLVNAQAVVYNIPIIAYVLAVKVDLFAMAGAPAPGYWGVVFTAVAAAGGEQLIHFLWERAADRSL